MLEMAQNQFMNKQHTLPKWKSLKTSPFRLLQPPKAEIVKIQFFQNHHTLKRWEIVENQTKDHHKLLMLKFIKTCAFKTTITSQSRNFPKSVIARQAHPI